MGAAADVLRMLNGEMSCRPRSRHPARALATNPHICGPPPGPEGRGLRNRSLPRPPPSQARSGREAPHGSPGRSLDTLRATPEPGGRLNVKIMLTTNVRNNQLGPGLLAAGGGRGEGRGPRGGLAPAPPPSPSAQTALHRETQWHLPGPVPVLLAPRWAQERNRLSTMSR